MGSSVGSYYVVYNMDATLKTDVIAGLPAYMPNPDKVVPHWPKDNRNRRIEETHASVDKRAEEFKNGNWTVSSMGCSVYAFLFSLLSSFHSFPLQP